VTQPIKKEASNMGIIGSVLKKIRKKEYSGDLKE
jgi:hypothetical protein